MLLLLGGSGCQSHTMQQCRLLGSQQCILCRASTRRLHHNAAAGLASASNHCSMHAATLSIDVLTGTAGVTRVGKDDKDGATLDHHLINDVWQHAKHVAACDGGWCTHQAQGARQTSLGCSCRLACLVLLPRSGIGGTKDTTATTTATIAACCMCRVSPCGPPTVL